MKQILKILLLFALFDAGCTDFTSNRSLHTAPPDRKYPARPNIIIILCDDLGYGDISGFGFNDAVTYTPRLDQLAREGVKLTTFLVPMPYCAPSRASLLTGRYPFRTGLVHNPTPDQGINDYGLSPSEITLAEALQDAGYRTGCVGKWHLGHTPKYLPTRQGFDYYLGILYSNDMRPVQLVENEEVVEYPVIQGNLTNRYTRESIRFIRAAVAEERPFFLYLAHAMPHKPLAASEAFYTPQTPDNLYEDVIRELDWSLGQIVDELSRLGIDRDTLLIFTSDNGATYGGNNGGLRGKKATAWDGGLRVPFIARWPGHIPGGLSNNAPTTSVDLFPTLIRLAEATLPKDRIIDGRDLWPLLISPTADSQHEFIVCMKGDRVTAIHSGKWKFHVQSPASYTPPGDLSGWKDPRGPDGITIIAPLEQYTPADYPGLTTGVEPEKWMLFNIQEDPGEQIDVSDNHPEVVRQMKRYAESITKDLPEFPPPKATEFRRITGGRLNFWEFSDSTNGINE
jgi:uncharacterized sulfatase